MKFAYFRDPDGFAYKANSEVDCSICSVKGIWFEASGFYGVNQIDSICDKCLVSGKLKELNIETNIATKGSAEDMDEIVYATPSLPTWQDMDWPYIEGSYCVFERIASRQDFESIEEFKASFLLDYVEHSDLDCLWEGLPDRRLKSYKQAGGISVYLFTNNGKKCCTWDAN